MTSVASAIASLLFDHDTVIVPGLGAFVRHDQSAHVNVITNEFQRPSSQLSFDPRQREENNLVIESLMASDGLTNDEARTAIATFVSDCFARLKEEGAMTLPGLGTLSMDEQQNLVFEPEDNNFTGDAFGLEDLEATPVYKGDPVPPLQDVPREESVLDALEPTPKKDLPEERQPHRHTWWIWVLLLLLAAAGVALWYFQFRPVPTKPWPMPVLTMQPREQLLPREETSETPVTPETPETPEVPATPETQVTPETAPEVAPAPVEVVKPEPTSKAFIVGGCFSVEQNALNMTAEAREQGCTEAFVMKRGSKYFVCYGQYPSTADAKAALPEVLQNYNQKAWILTK